MNFNEVGIWFGIIGGLSAMGSFYYAWKNDKLSTFIRYDPNIMKAFEGNENEPNFALRLQIVLHNQVNTRKKLRDAFSIAKQMHFAKPMDNALIEINKRAIELGDLDFAYKVARSAYFALALDEMLMNVVNASIESGNLKLANKCADRMHFAVDKDMAKKKIINKLGVEVQ